MRARPIILVISLALLLVRCRRERASRPAAEASPSRRVARGGPVRRPTPPQRGYHHQLRHSRGGGPGAKRATQLDDQETPFLTSPLGYPSSRKVAGHLPLGPALRRALARLSPVHVRGCQVHLRARAAHVPRPTKPMAAALEQLEEGGRNTSTNPQVEAAHCQEVGGVRGTAGQGGPVLPHLAANQLSYRVARQLDAEVERDLRSMRLLAHAEAATRAIGTLPASLAVVIEGGMT